MNAAWIRIRRSSDEACRSVDSGSGRRNDYGCYPGYLSGSGCPYRVELTYDKVNTLIGKVIPVETVKSILESLEMKIVSETAEGLVIDVPVYRIDVQRDVDVIEDILRIYGYNNVEFSDNVKSNLSYQTPTDRSYKLQNLISEQLCGCGFNEILNNSLTRSAYYDNLSTYRFLTV